MAEEAKLSLPASGHEIVSRILAAYSRTGETPVGLGDVARTAVISRTVVSGNHGFLESLGLVTKGKKRALTESGQRLAGAIAHRIQDDKRREWRAVLSEPPATQGVIHMIRVNQPIAKEDMSAKVASFVGATASSQTTTGANCLIDLLQQAGIIEESGGKYVLVEAVAEPRGAEEPTASAPVQPKQQEAQRPETVPSRPPSGGLPTVHIDIQVHISPDAKPEQIEHIFASMAKHLYGKK